MDASRGFLSGTVDRFKMVKILIFAHQLCFPIGNLCTPTATNPYFGRSSRRNQAAGWLPWWHPSLPSSCSYTTLPSRSTAILASACQQAAACRCMWWCILPDCMPPFSTLNDQSIGSQKKRIIAPSHLTVFVITWMGDPGGRICCWCCIFVPNCLDIFVHNMCP
jgi:hypothetical protein